MSAKKPAGKKAAPKTRLAPEDRKRHIVETAADFFAEHGFAAGTADLARALGVSQPLMYRYFPSKQDLIQQAYEHAFPSAHYYARWLRELEDRKVPLRDRLVRFYLEYTSALLNPKFLRLSIWARLAGVDAPNAKYTGMLNQEILPRIARALRHDVLGESRPRVRNQDLELVQSLHGSIYYVCLRRMHQRLPADVNELVVSKIDVFLDGAARVLEGSRRGGPRPPPT